MRGLCGKQGLQVLRQGMLEPKEHEEGFYPEGHWPNVRCQIPSGVKKIFAYTVLETLL